MKERQHEPLRIPEGWGGQNRALIVQLERILDDIYARLPARGKIKELDIRKVWAHEQYDFSKWLAAEENISELGNTLNLSLTDIEEE